MIKKPQRYISLQRFLIFVVVISVAAPATIAGFLLIRENFQRTVDYDSSVTATNYIELLEAGMTMPLWNIAPELGQPLIDSVSIDPSVVQIHVKDVYGNRFLVHDMGIASDALKPDSLIKLSRNITYEDELLGRVDIAYSLSSARSRAVSESRLLVTIIISQLMFTIVLVSYFLRRRVVNPVKQLEVAAVGIAEGDLKTSIPSLNNDEFGALSQQLERMRGSLESSFSTLEERVKERTVDLVNLNKELKQTQGDLVQSEKLAALGALVAGIAHELNTPIGNGLTVSSSLYEETKVTRRKLDQGITRSALDVYIQDMTEGTHLVVSSLERASELVSGFKQVAMDRTSAQRRRFELLAVLKETVLTMSPVFKHTPYKIKIECKKSIMLDSYPGPVGQIITNLLNNALIHAFDGAETGEINISGKEINDQRICLTVSDNGCGIPLDNITKIYDPFFTTKLGAGGNGLGMHIVHNIVTGVLGGSIDMNSTEGVGTTFIINIPIVAPAALEENGMNKTINKSGEVEPKGDGKDE